MNTSLQLDIISPEHSLLSVSAKMVLIPGEDGLFGVLPEHMNLIAEIIPGVVEVHHGEVVERFYVASGVAQVNASSCVILVEEAIPVAAVDVAQLQSRLELLRSAILTSDSESERAGLQIEVDFVEMVLSENTSNK